LTEEDLSDFKTILENVPEKAKSNFIKKWFSLDTQLRNALARKRASNKGVESLSEQREHEGFDVYVEKTASEAMNRENPAEREMVLDKFRWKTIDEMTEENPYDSGAVFGFALKFKIASRWAERKAEKGRNKVKSFVKEALQEKNHE
jgi:hypothetical protein